MRAGRLTERLVIEQQANAKDTFAQNVGTWSVLATVWGEATPVTSKEALVAGQVQGRGEVRFRIRYRADVTEAMRIDWRGQKFEIVAPPVNVGGRRVELEIMGSSGIRLGA